MALNREAVRLAREAWRKHEEARDAGHVLAAAEYSVNAKRPLRAESRAVRQLLAEGAALPTILDLIEELIGE